MKVEKIVKRALQKIQVQNARQPVKPEDMSDGIDSLNGMMARWEADGLSLGWSPVSNPSQEAPIPPEAEDAVIYNLAVRLAPDFGVTTPQEVIGGALTFLADLERDQAVATPIRPILSVPTPSGWGMEDAVSFYGPIVG